MKKILIIIASIIQLNSYTQADTSLGYIEPTRILSHSSNHPVYPMESVKNGEEGQVTITFTVGKTGKIKKAYIKKSSGYPALDKSALTFVKRKIKFKPATKDGTKIESKLTLPFDFRLN